MINDFIVSAAQLCIAIAILILSKYVIPYLKARIEDLQYDWIANVAMDGVQCAEQTIVGKKTGAEKKQMVFDLVSNWAVSKGINLTDEQIHALIESAVYAMKEEVV